MVIYQENKIGNAEVTIDFDRHTVDFNMNNKKPNENLCYFTHQLFLLIGFIMILISYIIFHEAVSNFLRSYIKPIVILYLEYYIILNEYSTVFMILVLIVFLAIVRVSEMIFFIIIGYISLFLHKNIKWLRDNYPKTNGFIHYLFLKKKKIDFSKNKYNKKYIIDNNKLYLFDYEIAYHEFYYEGDNRIKKFYTKSVEPESHKGENMNYIAIYEFEKPLIDGILTYR